MQEATQRGDCRLVFLPKSCVGDGEQGRAVVVCAGGGVPALPDQGAEAAGGAGGSLEEAAHTERGCDPTRKGAPRGR